MRIRIVRRPTMASVDGVSLERYEPGRDYEVGNSLGALMLAEGWGEPALEAPEPAALLAPIVVEPPPAPGAGPVSDSREETPPNLVREIPPAESFRNE